MTPEQWEQVQAAFAVAIELAPEARLGHVERTSQDPLVRREVAALLAAAGGTGCFLDAPLPLADFANVPALDVGPGAVIGSYRIVGEIGAGGMGRVYLAARDDGAFQQSVAIKVLRLGLAGADPVTRFRRERQVLAQLRHPGIARLVDGGAMPDGRPYLVMEHVDGQPIDAWCDGHRASIRARLEIFLGVCAAVQHAHQNLVVHRDLKPSNVLVTADGTAHLLDFGIAKILHADGTGAEATQGGDRAMTPRYASPEQIRGGTITTAADIYALGVILHEMLTGRTPFGDATTSAYDVERAICEAERTRPSTALARSPDVDSIARARSCDGRALVRRLEGDLDVIVLKSIAREPERRYPSVEALADDLRRHLRGEPVAARPDSWRYRTSKFVGRHPAGIGLAAIATMAIIAASIAAVTFAFRAERERLRASERAEEAERSAYVASMAAASAAIDDRRSTEARSRLDDAPAQLRGWEWDHLYARLDQSSVWMDGPNRADALDSSPDCALVAIGGASGTVFVIDARTREVLRRFEQPDDVRRVAFHPDGRSLLWTAGGHLWQGDLESGAAEREAREPAVEALAVREPWLYLGRADGRVQVLDLATREEVALLEPIRAGSIKIVVASGDGATVAAAGADGVHVWRTGDWSARHVLGGHPRGVMEICFSPDGRLVAAGDVTGMVRLWEVESGAPFGFPLTMEGEVWGLAFISGGRELAIASKRSVHYLDLATGLEVGAANLLAWPIRLRAIDDDTIVAACNGSVRSLSRGNVDMPVLPVVSNVWGAAFAPDGARVVSNAGTWELASRTNVVPHASKETGYRFDRAGRRYVAARGRVTVRGALDGSEVAVLGGTGPRRWYWTADMHPDGAIVATAGRNGEQIELRDAATLALVRSLTTGEKSWTYDVRFSPDGRWLASATERHGLRIWDVATGALVAHPEPRSGIDRAVHWSPDGRLVAAGGSGSDTILWETRGWTIAGRLPRRSTVVSAIAFHPSGSRLATADDREVRMWDVESGREVLALQGHVGTINCIDWSRDGSMLLSGATDGTIRLWSARRSSAADQVLLVGSPDEAPDEDEVASDLQ
jgi:WD40 repeat protein